MKNVVYELTEPVTRIFEEMAVLCYGIRCLENGRVTQSYDDVLPDRKAVKRLVDLCNLYDAAPEHLLDIIMNYMP